MRAPSPRSMLLGLVCVCATACVQVGKQAAEPWRLFSLSPLPATTHTAAIGSAGPVEPTIAVGPIRLPEYLDQDQIVTRISRNDLTFSDNDRWAEPLEDNVAQVLAENLSTLLQTDQITVHPWPGPQRAAYQLEIDVLSFETDTSGMAHLDARWLLRDVANRQTIVREEARQSAAAAGGSTEQSVASLSQALGDLSVEIAKVICETVQRCVPQSGAGQRETGLLRSGSPRHQMPRSELISKRG
jgi:uncharacterized lipoprotein YmbA